MRTAEQSAEFNALVERVHAGRMPVDAFFTATKGTWERMATHLMRRWRAPAWVERDEVVQELMVGAWRAMWRFNPARSKSGEVGSYVGWNAIDFAKKKLHKMRGAKLCGNADSNPSRHEKLFGDFARAQDADGGTEWIDAILRVEAEQENRAIDSQDRMRVENACVSDVELVVVRVVGESRDMVEAAITIYENVGAREALGLRRPIDAARLVVNTVRDVSARVEAAAI